MKKSKNPHSHVIAQVPPDYYQKGIEKNVLQRIWHTNKLSVILDVIDTEPKKILDVGCASGWFLSNISVRFPKARCYGIDLYERAIEHGKKLYPTLMLKAADAHKIPFPSDRFDLVICTEVLEHVEDPKGVLLEIKRVLKRRGMAAIELDSGSLLFSITWFLWRKFHGKVWNEAHLHSFNIQKLERLLASCGFKIIRKKRFNLGMAMVFLIEK